MNNANNPVIIAYIPVLHQGYRQLFAKHPEAKTLFILDDSLIGQFPHLAKEIRALPPELVKTSIESWGVFETVELLNETLLRSLADQKQPIVAPKEDVIETLITQYLPNNPVTFDDIFLRWDKHNTTASFEPLADEVISDAEFDRQMIEAAYQDAAKSSDWWRRVGAVAIRDGHVLFVAHNTHLPTPHQPYIDGDPRNNFHKGVNLELSTAIHAEAEIIAKAAKTGVSLDGADLYLTTFPCPPCAKLVANAGIKNLYFHQGYGVLDGQRVLTEGNVKVIRVKTTD